MAVIYFALGVVLLAQLKIKILSFTHYLPFQTCMSSSVEHKIYIFKERPGVPFLWQ